MGKKKKHKKGESKNIPQTEHILLAIAVLELIEVLLEIVKVLIE